MNCVGFPNSSEMNDHFEKHRISGQLKQFRYMRSSKWMNQRAHSWKYEVRRAHRNSISMQYPHYNEFEYEKHKNKILKNSILREQMENYVFNNANNNKQKV